MNDMSEIVLPKNTIVVPRTKVNVIRAGDIGFAIDTTPTHHAYTRNSVLYRVDVVMVINGLPSVEEPMHTQQTMEELRFTQGAVAKLLGIGPNALIPFTDMDFVDKADYTYRNHAIQSNQTRFRFGVDDPSLRTIEDFTGLHAGNQMVNVNDNRVFRGAYLHYKPRANGVEIAISY